MIKICGLWQGEDKNRNPYYSGSVGGVKFLIFKNTRKEKDKQPDYQLFIDENQKEKTPPAGDGF